MNTPHFATKPGYDARRLGFSLIELIPSIAMLSVISLVSMKSILAGKWMRELSMRKSIVIESYNLVQSEWRIRPGTAAVCRKNENDQWEIINFPNDSWIPKNAVNGVSIEWRRREIMDRSIPVIAAEYRIPGEKGWTWWVSTVETWQNE